jgi:hypothetical protein
MVNARLSMSFFAEGVEGQAKTYGPVFSRLVAQASTAFVAEKVNEQPPNIDTLKESVSYIAGKLAKYPRAYCALAYGVGKAISMLEGAVGSGAKVFSASLMKPIMLKNGLDKILGHSSETFEAAQKWAKFTESIGFADKGVVSLSPKNGSEIAVKVTGCDYADACNKIVQEGISRVIGGTVCAWAVAYTAASEMGTGDQHDYKMNKVEPPNCEFALLRPK